MGTMMVRDINPGAGHAVGHIRAVVNDTLFFAADDGRHGCELWRMTDYQLVNDECDRAITVYAGQTVEGANYQATAAISSGCGEMDTADVWDTFVPTVGGEYRIRVSSDEMDTTLAVYNKKCSGSELVCNDDYNPYLGTDSQVSLLMTKGAPYAIRVAGFDGREGSFQLVVDAGTCTEPVVSDLNGDCVVNLLDFSIMASEWMTCSKMPVDLCD
jgi:hypothetical protein